MRMNKVSSPIHSLKSNPNVYVGLSFVESSALNSSNVDMAFEKLITSIYYKMMNKEFDDRLE